MNLISRVKGILINPKEEWNTIKSEETSNNDLILKYALPLAVAGAVALLIQYLIGGYFSPLYSTITIVVTIVVQLVMLIVAAYVIYILADSFNSKKDLNSAMKLIVYAQTASFVAAIIANLHFYLAWVGIFGLYGIYLFWLGLSTIMETPDDKKLPYTIVAAIIIIIVGFFSATIVGSIVGMLAFLY